MKKILYGIVFVLPFVLGATGFYMAGNGIKDACYNGVSLYFMSLNEDSVNILIEIARWYAPIMTASGLILAIKSAYYHFRDRLACMHSDSTAIYSDTESGNLLFTSVKHGVLADNTSVKAAKDHVIMFADDVDNLNFYQTHKAKFQDKHVYICLEKMDSYLLKESQVHFFNSNEIVARQYWKSRNLLEFMNDNMKVDIAIIGFGPLGQRILHYGLLNNIYTSNQKITYHIFGDSSLYEQVYPAFPMMNQDQVVHHGTDWKANVSIFATMERVIITEEPDLDLVQNLLYTCGDTQIDYFSKGNIILEDIYKTDQLKSFGKAEEIYTEENIKTNTLYHAAMELNYKYACLYGAGASDNKEQAMQQEWEALDGFTKGSNIASADYHQIRVMVMGKRALEGKPMTDTELAEGEHIRWSRFHYLNHWTYGVPENGKNKDPKKKIHVCLVPFEELPEVEKQKDVEAVNLLLELFAK